MSIDTTATTEHEAPIDVDAATPAEGARELVEDELLVEEISIDGMCGVY